MYIGKEDEATTMESLNRPQKKVAAPKPAPVEVKADAEAPALAATK